MDELANHLTTSITGFSNSYDIATWENLKERLNILPLETALYEVNLSASLTEQVIKKTWELIFPADRAVFQHLLLNHDALPLSKLYRFLFRSTHKKLSVNKGNGKSKRGNVGPRH